MYSLVKPFARTYHKCWMFWHLRRTSKHSSSIEHAPKSSPTPLSPTELTTKATASISLGNSRMLRSSRVGLVATNCWASWWSWLSWIQWHSSNIWEIGNQIEKTTTNTRKFYLYLLYSIYLNEFIRIHSCKYSTFGPVKVFLWHSFFSSWRTKSCRFLTQYWTSLDVLAIWTRAEVQCGVARPHKKSCRESKSVFWSDFVVQRVFRLNLREMKRSLGQRQ